MFQLQEVDNVQQVFQLLAVDQGKDVPTVYHTHQPLMYLITHYLLHKALIFVKIILQGNQVAQVLAAVQEKDVPIVLLQQATIIKQGLQKLKQDIKLKQVQH
jgi:hypothetical protein